MRLRSAFFALAAVFTLLGVGYAYQRQRFFFEVEKPLIMPSDADEKTEWTFARLQYKNVVGVGDRIWAIRGNWTVDYPKADRQFVQGVRRLSRVHARSVEQVVSLEDDEIFKWPWIYAVEAGHWDLSDAEAQRLREYLLKGGFLMTDDFHGSLAWDVFMRSMNRVFPDRQVVEITDKDAIFHVLYDLDERFQVPGVVSFITQQSWEYDGYDPHWRAIYDDNGRIMVAMCFNMDLGDGWEWADAPEYPERYSSLAYRIGINYIVYAMTH